MDFARRTKHLRILLVATVLGLGACTRGLPPSEPGVSAASHERINGRPEGAVTLSLRGSGAIAHFVPSGGRRETSTRSLSCVPDVQARNRTLGDALATQLRSPVLSQNYVWTMQEHFENQKYREAERLAAISLSLREVVLGQNDLSVAQGLITLGLTYDVQRRYADAEALYARALLIQEELLGYLHPFVASTIENLAFVYVAECRFSEARALHHRVLAIRESVQGPGHPDMAKSLASYAEFEEQVAAVEANNIGRGPTRSRRR